MSEKSVLVSNISQSVDMPMLDNPSVGNNDTKVQNNNIEKDFTFDTMEDRINVFIQSFNKPKTHLSLVLKSRITENDTAEEDLKKETDETTILKSIITDPTQVTQNTRFYELGIAGQNEILQMEQLIHKQKEKSNHVRLQAKKTSLLCNAQEKTGYLTTEAEILRIKLENQNFAIYKLIDQCHKQRMNINAASYAIQGTYGLGTAENWTFFENLVTQMQCRIEICIYVLQLIEEAVNSLGKYVPFSSELLSKIMVGQKRVLLSLAGRAVDIHNEVGRLVRRHKS
ncbi:unnamed protein product [Rhizopus stolonifer]